MFGRRFEKALDVATGREMSAFGYLPSNAISNTVRNAMLERGPVTAERLRARGVA